MKNTEIASTSEDMTAKKPKHQNDMENTSTETEHTEISETKAGKSADDLKSKTELTVNKDAKEHKKTVTFGENIVDIIDDKDNDDLDISMPMDLSQDKYTSTSTEQEASIESHKLTEGSAQQSPYEVDTDMPTEEEEDDYEIPCSQIKRCPRMCRDMFTLGEMDNANDCDTEGMADTDTKDTNEG